MKKTIELSPTMKLQAEDFIESATALIAKRGRGKSGGVKVIEEELCHAGLPFVVFDPTGIHWGLRSSFDGKKASGFEVLVIGGEHGDLPLDRKAGRIVARAIAQNRTSLIIDFSGTSKASYREFITDFSDELFQVNQVSRLVIIEEAPRLVPQRLYDEGMKAAFGAVEQLVSMGRNKGIGCILVSQRAATINKDVLTQVDNLIVMGITGPQDRKALKEWVEENADDDLLEQFLGGLAALKPREAWLWSPEREIFRGFKFRDFTTFHPDRTHLRRMGLMATKATETDTKKLVQALGSELAALANKAKEEDPKALKARVRELEHKLQKAVLNGPPPSMPEVKEVPVLKDSQIERLWKITELMVDHGKQLLKEASDIQRALPDAKLGVRRVLVDASALEHRVRERPGREVLKAAPRAPAPIAKPPADGISKPQQRILDSLAQLEGMGLVPVSKDQLALWCEVSPTSGGYFNNLGTLRSSGLIEYPTGGMARLSAEGRALAREAQPMSVEEMQESLCRKVGAAKAKVLRALIEIYPKSISKDELAERIEVSPISGGYFNNLGALRTLGVIDYPAPGMVAALPVLFLENSVPH